MSGSLASTIGQINPIRYRGYYYDTESGLYYLMSRYYDAEVGRFINADDTDYLDVSGTVLGGNLFAYCENKPVHFLDPKGNAINPIGILIGSAVGATAGVLLAKLLGLSGWKKGLFIAGCTAAGAVLGNFLSPYMNKLLVLAKAKLATLVTVKVASWQQAEQLLRKTYKGVAKTINTPYGKRVVDSLTGKYARESKYGYQGLSKFIQQEIAKDSYLISKGYKIEWHFYWSQVSNTGGPSGPLRKALQAAGIKIIEHFKR